MKKLETLKKTLEAENINDTLKDIINCDNVDVETLTEREKFATLIYAELAKSLNNKTNELLLDCNYSQSKNHISNQYLVTYFRYISKDTTNDTMIQLYSHVNAKKATCNFKVCFSCAKTVREQQKALEENNFTVLYNSKTKRAKTTQRLNIDYSEIVSVIKTICAILADANKTETTENKTTKSVESKTDK